MSDDKIVKSDVHRQLMERAAHYGQSTIMSAETCIWCGSHEPVKVDPDGDGCCARCLPLLDTEGCCGYCGELDPVKMVGSWPACIGCLNAFHEGGMLARATDRSRPCAYQLVTHARVVAAAKAMTTRERLEALAKEAGVTGDIWSLSLADFAHKVAEARCTKLGLVKSRDASDAGPRKNVANDREAV